MKANFETGLKICSKCRAEKGMDGFYKNKSTADGLNWHCKQCTNAESSMWYYKNKYKRDASKKAWVQNNKDKVSANRRRSNEKYAGAPFVVYCHEDKFGSVVYIGNGSAGREREMSGSPGNRRNNYANRNLLWRLYFAEYNPTVHIIGRYNNKKDAELIELLLLRHLEQQGRYPLLNIA